MLGKARRVAWVPFPLELAALLAPAHAVTNFTDVATFQPA